MIVMSSLFYGSYGVWTRLMGDNFGPFMQSWIRATLVCLVMLPFVLWGKNRWERIRWSEDKWWLASWVGVNTLIGGAQYYAIIHIGIGLALLTLYAGYLTSMFVLGWLLNGERYTPDKVVATVFAVVGLVLAFGPTLDGATLFPFIAALTAGFCIGGDMVVAQKIKYNSAQTTILAWVTGMVGSIPLSFLLHEHVASAHDYAQWGYLLAFVVVCVAASWLSVHGVKLVEAGVAGILGLLEVVWGIAFGVMFFHEQPSLLAYLGAACIIAAAIIPYVMEFRKMKPAAIEELPA